MTMLTPRPGIGLVSELLVVPFRAPLDIGVCDGPLVIRQHALDRLHERMGLIGTYEVWAREFRVTLQLALLLSKQRYFVEAASQEGSPHHPEWCSARHLRRRCICRPHLASCSRSRPPAESGTPANRGGCAQVFGFLDPRNPPVASTETGRGWKAGLEGGNLESWEAEILAGDEAAVQRGQALSFPRFPGSQNFKAGPVRGAWRGPERATKVISVRQGASPTPLPYASGRSFTPSIAAPFLLSHC